MGFRSGDALQTIIDLLQLPITVQMFEDKLAPIYQELFPKCDIMPGKLFDIGSIKIVENISGCS